MLCRVFIAAVAAASAAVLIAPDGASARFGGGGGGHRFGAHPAFRPFHAQARFPSFRRRFAPLWYPPYGDLLGDGYGGYDVGAVVPGYGGPVTILRVDRPPCRVQFETRTVPAEAGGSRSVSVTRCAPATTGQAGPYGAVAQRSDDAGLTTGSIADDMRSDAPGCRADTRTVPAEGGGERKITITRCQ
jgi:hypothetical protein